MEASSSPVPLLRSASLPALVLLLACGDERPSPAVAPDTGAAESELTYPDLPTAGCDAPDYDWLPLEGMGEVLAVDEDPSLSLPASTINALMENYGYTEFTPVPYGVRAFKVRYVSQDRGERVELSAWVVLPDVQESTTFPTLLWLHPTMGWSDECAPTARGIEGGAFPVLFAAQGMAVAAPDYIGMVGFGEPSGQLHPYAVAEPTAIASLDALRAMQNLVVDQDLPAKGDPAMVLQWGASEGGFAALWTDRYMGAYAPEYQSAGLIAAIPPTDLQALATRGVTELGETTAGLAGAMVAMQDWYRSDAPLDEVLAGELSVTVPEAMRTSCGDVNPFADVESVSDVYTQPFIDAALVSDWDSVDPWGCFLYENSIANAVIPRSGDAPVLLVLGEEDQLAWSPPARDDAVRLCDQGYEIETIRCAGADHVTAGVDSLVAQWRWMQDRMAGAPLTTPCVMPEPVDCAAE